MLDERLARDSLHSGVSRIGHGVGGVDHLQVGGGHVASAQIQQAMQ
jgi:hypothetical protein